MEKTPLGTSVGVDDPFDYVERCDHVTDDGKCRYAFECEERRSSVRSSGRSPRDADPDSTFFQTLRDRDYRCPVVTDAGPDWEWADCPHFRCTNRSRECIRCGLEEVRMAHDDARPLLEEHHLSYRASANGGTNGHPEELTHEITVYLCRWCHAKVHDSFARIDDDANPPPEALAAREERRSQELDELGFDSAADRYRDS
ncbi:hypothetical protein ACFPYI_05350 [Halomarina salina]|uniref:HNH endonuclease n=1 Tax=Halomarina salina TaxID=1872699 RepID=A0ABD5RKA6_9EURY|nr:hypothetical protein [Halomarina salina]